MSTTPTTSISKSCKSTPSTTSIPATSFSATFPTSSTTSSPATTGPGRLPSSPLTMGGNPKPVETSKAKDDIGEWKQLIPGVLKDSRNYTNAQVLANLKAAASAMQKRTGLDFWITDDGQAELLRRNQSEQGPPTATSPWGSSTSTAAATLSVFDYTEKSKAMIDKGSLSAVNGEEEWIEIELTADSGACDTVIPRKLAESIPIMPSLASLRGMEYEVANGASIPNLGERRCLIWTEGATEAKRMNMQVADVHKGLPSLSRCADMGFEGRFGRTMGALICEKTNEVIPLTRKGNLYVLRVWVKAAPFGRQEP